MNVPLASEKVFDVDGDRQSGNKNSGILRCSHNCGFILCSVVYFNFDFLVSTNILNEMNGSGSRTYHRSKR